MLILICSPLANFGKHPLLDINYDFLGCRIAAPGSTTENFVTGSSSDDGRWTIRDCSAAVNTNNVFGSICERGGSVTTAPPTTSPLPDSGSTFLESGTAVLLGMLFFC